ncbi:MAG: CBS domain-containing protein [Candidatus Heimdallarchaeota archaeon]|nr:CBS domain-containing protein [Candidatus Heimdallarchaeota archaeon]
MKSNFLANIKTTMVISEVMTSTVHTISPKQTVKELAKKMTELEVGSLIVQKEDGNHKSIGIITERDIVTRVVAANLDPSKLLADDIATRPVVTAPPTMDISEALSLMDRLNIRRLVIVEENVIVGICTYRDLLHVVPQLLEIANEKEKITMGREADDEDGSSNIEDFEKDHEFSSEVIKNPDDLKIGFYCQQCGEWCGEDEEPFYDEDSVGPICYECYQEKE